MNLLFVSYSTENSNIAHRIYYDLIRCGIKAWLYEIDGQIGNSFRKEIFNKLHSTRYFCLIDSSAARNSIYVNEECNYFIALMNQNNSNLRFISCQIEQIGKWRDKQHFKNQNDIRYIDFFNYGKFDESKRLDRLDAKEKYRAGIEKLCEVLGTDFIPWATIPNWRDFEKEITALNIDTENTEILVSDYKNFIKRYRSNSRNAESRIKIIINDCDNLGVKLLTNYLALGEIQVNSGKKLEARTTFKELISVFPDDARCWAALGASDFYSAKYNSALENFSHAISIMSANKDNQYYQKHYGEVLHNQVRVFIALNRLTEADKALNSLSGNFRELPEIRIAEINLLIKSDKILLAEDLYLKLSKQLNENTILNSRDVKYSIAEIERNFGEYYSRNGYPLNAVKHLETACAMDPNEVRYAAELLLLYYATGRIQEGFNLIYESYKLKPKDEVDEYFYGLICYLNGETGHAKQYYNRSKLNWSYYTELIK
jgi:hypothetical protein